MKERADLPAAEVAGEKQHALTTFFGCLEVLESLVGGDLRCVPGCVAREQAKLGEQSSQRAIYSAQNLATLLHGLAGKRHLQVAHADSPQPGMPVVGHPADQQPDTAGQRPWQYSNE